MEIFNIDKFIRARQVKEVTTTNLFLASGSPDPEGLVSQVIFGTSTIDRQSRYGYIQLHGKFMHPIIYKRIFKRSYRKIDGIIAGTDYYNITEKGDLVPDPEGYTGLEWLYKNFERIKFQNINMEQSDDDIELSLFKEDVRAVMKKYTKDQLFIDKIIVIPIAYRDIDIRDGQMGIDELNSLYRSIMNKARMLQDNKNVKLFDLNRLMFQMQLQIAQLSDHYKAIISGKYGLQRKRALSKNVDYGSIVVLSGHEFDGDKFYDEKVNVDKTGFPLTAIVTNMQLFIIRRVEDFLRQLPMTKKNGEQFSLREKEMYYDGEKIKEYIQTYAHSISERFNFVETPDGGNVTFTYKVAGKEKTRFMTITDVLYMFAYSEAELAERHMLITRHPTMDSFNVIPTLIHVLSTIKTIEVEAYGMKYPYYPDIDYIFDKYGDLRVRENAIKAERELSGYFTESEKISTLQLEGMDGDLDGDKNIARPVFSDEANEECRQKREALASHFNMRMENMKILGTDSVQALYSFTVFRKDAPYAKPATIEKLKSAKSDDITVTYLFKELRLADTTKFKRENDIRDLIPIKNGEFGYKGKDTVCTIGQFIAWKLLFEDCKIPVLTEVLSKKVIERTFTEIGVKIQHKEITIDDFKKCVNRYEAFSLRMTSFVNPSVSTEMLILTPEIRELKARLIEENKAGIEANDPYAAAKVEKPLITKVEEVYGDKPEMETYRSGVVTLDNNYKVLALMAGALPQDEDFNKFKVVTDSLSDGLQKKDLSYFGNMGLVGGYSRGKAPEVGGAMAKLAGYVYQTMRLDKFGTDCGIKVYCEIYVDPKAEVEYYGRYVPEGNELVMITKENFSKYAGKKVPMRSVLTCKTPLVCNKCAGDGIYNILGIYDRPVDFGLKLNKQQHELVQKRLKLSHDTSVKFKHLDFSCIVPSNKKGK
jgi:hypothetical protein